ncbi:M14 family zinc carboxypeptidase [Sunxiuqinia elliptica]|nr:M14 family zinc carboxypeptidase [Sunxiuqinia elliptica]
MKYLSLIVVFLFSIPCFAQLALEAEDPPNKKELPYFFKSKIEDIESELNDVKSGKVVQIATSPGNRPVYAVYYGDKDQFDSQANYNSAVAARNPVFYARKSESTKPVIYFLGPVHGHEIEGQVGLLNLIQIAETGKDHRGREWPLLKQAIEKCRVIIVPNGNPDGLVRCPYDSFVGLPGETMTKYGQGTRPDGSLWRWPQAKSLHPMKGEVGILGAYFNDDGINMMHDDFFFPMAKETEAILKIARDEAPDMTVSLHSHNQPPCVLQAAHVPVFMKNRVADFAEKLNSHYKNVGLPYMTYDWLSANLEDDPEFPPKKSFNLVSALHHLSGTMSFVFECSHGTINEKDKAPIVSYDGILDVQLHLYEQMFQYLMNNRLYWE